MRYQFDTEIASTLTIAQLIGEEAVLCEIFEHIRLLRRKREAEAAVRSRVAVEREKAKRVGVWVDKGVGERRISGG